MKQGDLLAVFAGRIAPLGPKDVPSGFVKTRIKGAVLVKKLGLIGDEQADLAVHGGLDKAVYAYPELHYSRWREDFPEHLALWGPGSLGENLSLSDFDESTVYVGDVFRLGSVILEITQPRKPCFKLALRFNNDQRLAQHMIRTSRTGWYFRVLEDGYFIEGDKLQLLERPNDVWSIKRVNEAAYDKAVQAAHLQEVAALPALSTAWRNQTTSAAASRVRTADKFRRFVLMEVKQEANSIRSLAFAPADGNGPALHECGQHVQIRLRVGDEDVIRRYTISSNPGSPLLRISVKREADGKISRLLHQLPVGAEIEISRPQGRFIFDRDAGRPAALISAGVGITPMLSMLHAAVTQDGRYPFVPEVAFFHAARNGDEHAFAEQIQTSLSKHPHARSRVFYSRPSEQDRRLKRYDQEGHITIEELEPLIDRGYDFYVCGPSSFMKTIKEGLKTRNVPDAWIKLETFDFSGDATRPPTIETQITSLPAASVEFLASGKKLDWTPDTGTLLELAEAAGIPVVSDCRMGLCGTCAVKIVKGGVTHFALEGPALQGEALLCCSIPATKDVVLGI